MLSMKNTLNALTSLILFGSPLMAEEAPELSTDASIEEHAAVGSRELDPAKRELMQQLRAKELEASGTESEPVSEAAIRRASGKIQALDNPFMLAPRAMALPQYSLASYAMPINYHFLINVTDSFRTFEMEDGSHWEVSPIDAYTLRNWRREDALVITPNYSWFSSHDYYITNKTSGSFVKANLVVGPLNHGPYSHWIIDVDYKNGHIFLENQMVWCINPEDMYILNDWAVNDHVIFGQYSTWFSAFDHILINVNMDNHIRAKQY